jgi:hypothetical protein
LSLERGGGPSTIVGSTGRKLLANLLVPRGNPKTNAQPERDRSSGADKREQPHDRRCNERRTGASKHGSERTVRCIHVAKPSGDKILGLRKPNDRGCRRQRKSKQSEHVSPFVTMLRE